MAKPLPINIGLSGAYPAPPGWPRNRWGMPIIPITPAHGGGWYLPGEHPPFGLPVTPAPRGGWYLPEGQFGLLPAVSNLSSPLASMGIPLSTAQMAAGITPTYPIGGGPMSIISQLLAMLAQMPYGDLTFGGPRYEPLSL